MARAEGGGSAGGSPQGATGTPSEPHLVAGTDGPSRSSQEGDGQQANVVVADGDGGACERGGDDQPAKLPQESEVSSAGLEARLVRALQQLSGSLPSPLTFAHGQQPPGGHTCQGNRIDAQLDMRFRVTSDWPTRRSKHVAWTICFSMGRQSEAAALVLYVFQCCRPPSCSLIAMFTVLWPTAGMPPSSLAGSSRHRITCLYIESFLVYLCLDCGSCLWQSRCVLFQAVQISAENSCGPAPLVDTFLSGRLYHYICCANTCVLWGRTQQTPVFIFCHRPSCCSLPLAFLVDLCLRAVWHDFRMLVPDGLSIPPHCVPSVY